MSYQLKTARSGQPACSLHIQVDRLQHCAPQPPPRYEDQLRQRYGVVPADLAGLAASPPLNLASPPCRLEKALSLKVSSPGIAAHEALFEDPGWLFHSARLHGRWDRGLLYPDGWRDESPTVSITPRSVFL